MLFRLLEAKVAKEKTRPDSRIFSWLGMRDSNPRMLGPEPSALPLGESPTLEPIVLQILNLRKRLLELTDALY